MAPQRPSAPPTFPHPYTPVGAAQAHPRSPRYRTVTLASPNHAERCLFGCQGGFGARVAVSAVTKVMLMGVGWRVARGGYVEEPAIQDATPATHATETFLGAPRALTRLLVGS
jgi:hypothetical protein